MAKDDFIVVGIEPEPSVCQASTLPLSVLVLGTDITNTATLNRREHFIGGLLISEVHSVFIIEGNVVTDTQIDTVLEKELKQAASRESSPGLRMGFLKAQSPPPVPHFL